MSKPSPVVLELSNPAAFSGQGSFIVVEMTTEDAAMRLARKLAKETGRRVTVRNTKMEIIDFVSAPTTQ